MSKRLPKELFDAVIVDLQDTTVDRNSLLVKHNITSGQLGYIYTKATKNGLAPRRPYTKAKLTFEQKNEILEHFKNQDLTQTQIAKKFGISRARANQYYCAFKSTENIGDYDSHAIAVNRFKREFEKNKNEVHPWVLEVMNLLKDKGFEVDTIHNCTMVNPFKCVVKVNNKQVFIAKPNQKMFVPNDKNVNSGYYRFQAPSQLKYDFAIFKTPRGNFVIPMTAIEFRKHLYIQAVPETTVAWRKYEKKDVFSQYLEAWHLLKE